MDELPIRKVAMADIRSHGRTGPAVSGTNGGEFRAKGDDEGAIFNMLVYPPCFTLIAMGIYNIEAMHASFVPLFMPPYSLSSV